VRERVGIVNPEIRVAIKIVAGTAIFIGLIFAFLERRYAPSAIVTEDSTILPAWVGWTGWILSGAASVAYILMDIIEWWDRRG
jgi:hypothetical protein